MIIYDGKMANCHDRLLSVSFLMPHCAVYACWVSLTQKVRSPVLRTGG